MVMSKKENSHLYDKAFNLFKEGEYEESIEEFKHEIETTCDPESFSIFMIANIYIHELNDKITALPYALEASKAKPRREMASINLVFCLNAAKRYEESFTEIKRFIKTGKNIDFYETLLEENNLKKEDLS